jgi:hypothetical protein
MLAVQLNVRKTVEKSLFPKQVKRPARGAQIVLIRLPVAEEFRRVVNTEAKVFCQKLKCSTFCRRETKRAAFRRG